MAVFAKFQSFVSALAGKSHDLLGTDPGTDADVLKVMLSNTAPNAATGVSSADITEISAGNGYTAGGAVVDNEGAASAGVFTLTGAKVSWTATGGAMASFRYLVLWNSTADLLIGFWDHGAQVDLPQDATYEGKFDNEDVRGDVLTIQ